MNGQDLVCVRPTRELRVSNDSLDPLCLRNGGGNDQHHRRDGLPSATGSLLTTIGVGDQPAGIATNPTTNMVCVTNSGPGTTGNSLMAIDASTNTVLATVDTRRFPTGPPCSFVPGGDPREAPYG